MARCWNIDSIDRGKDGPNVLQLSLKSVQWGLLISKCVWDCSFRCAAEVGREEAKNNQEKH